MVAIGITRTVTAVELRREAARAGDPKVTRRALAIAMVLDGRSRSEAAAASAMDRQTLRDWVDRFNADGLEGLSDRSHPGRPPSLSAEQQSELATWVEAGPDLAKDGVVRWRRADLCERIAASFGVTLDVRPPTSGCGDLRRNGARRAGEVAPPPTPENRPENRIARLRSPRGDETVQEADHVRLRLWCRVACDPSRAAGAGHAGGAGGADARKRCQYLGFNVGNTVGPWLGGMVISAGYAYVCLEPGTRRAGKPAIHDRCASKMSARRATKMREAPRSLVDRPAGYSAAGQFLVDARSSTIPDLRGSPWSLRGSP